SLEVVASGYGGFDRALVRRLKSLPGVRAAVPRVQVWSALVGPSGAVPTLVLGADLARQETIQDFPLRQGRPLHDEDGVWLEAAFAAGQGLKLGGPVHFWTPTGPAELPLRGLLEPQGASAASAGAVGVVPLRVAQRLFAMRGQVNSVQLILEEGAD